MKKNIAIDPFFENQPPLDFIEHLKEPVHTAPPPVWNQRRCREDEACLQGCCLVREFPDEEALLETAYDDFERFLCVHRLSGNGEKPYPVRTQLKPTDCFEDYTVSVSREGCTISAGDTEGIRRGLIWLEDEMLRRSGPFLPLGKLKRHPYIRSRISRCFFSPINRPPKNGEELADDIDYYPDEYLNRLAHDGTNGVWIYTKFRDLLPSTVIPEYGLDYKRRMDKLNATVAKCRRYGIRPYVFAIEPMALDDPELIAKYPEIQGASTWNGRHAFCTNNAMGRAYCEEATRTLFTLCPGLGGLIIITMGERGTACGSGAMVIDCPNCKDKKIGEVLSQTVEALQEGVRASGTKAEFVSWTYGHRMWNYEAVRDYVKSAPDDVMLMQNFEEMGYVEQLGKTRLAVDYWLSYPGPSQLFQATAEQAVASHKHLFAKTQVCCSHEVASVPYIPTPGILWDKYKAMRSYGVEGVMQCWYFGNYPSLMSKAAGELAFEGAFADKEAFLRRLAGIYWGEQQADAAAAAWSAFEEGYKQYPVNIMFSYYGPMHDGPVWELQLTPKNFPLPRSWQTIDPVNGDRIGECLLNGHTMEEALTLCHGMWESWREGLSQLPAPSGYYPQDEQSWVAQALEIQFHSGVNILEFYRRRDLLGRGEGDPRELLEQLRQLVFAEIENSRALLCLCLKDNRLGYHSEGEGFKYFPEKLESRIAQLEQLLKTEFVQVEERIQEGLPPLEYYQGVEEDSTAYSLVHGPIQSAAWADFDRPGAGFRAAIDGGELVMELRDSQKGEFSISPEFRLLWPDANVCIGSDGRVSVPYNVQLYAQVFGEKQEAELARWRVTAHETEGSYLTIRLSLQDILQGQKLGPMKIRIVAPSGASWIGCHTPTAPLGKSDLAPQDFVWLLP